MFRSQRLGLTVSGLALRLLRGSWAFWGRVSALGLGFGISLKGSRSLRVEGFIAIFVFLTEGAEGAPYLHPQP